MMANPPILDELTRKVFEVLPEGMDRLRDDMQKNIRAALASAMARMDLVTREEFDVQAGVLTRTREKLSVLEARVATLERELLGTAEKSQQGTVGNEPGDRK